MWSSFLFLMCRPLSLLLSKRFLNLTFWVWQCSPSSLLLSRLTLIVFESKINENKGFSNKWMASKFSPRRKTNNLDKTMQPETFLFYKLAYNKVNFFSFFLSVLSYSHQDYAMPLSFLPIATTDSHHCYPWAFF